MSDVQQLFDRVPVGWSVMHLADRSYGVTRAALAGGRIQKLYAEELGGTDVVSANLYGDRLRPCEMPAAKVLDFLSAAVPAAAPPTSRRATMPLPEPVVALLRGVGACYVATLMPDGSPQLTQTWVDTDGEHVIVNTVVGYQKARNVSRDPRVSVTVSDADDPSRYVEIRGRVVNATTDGGADHIETLARRYLGRPYPWWGGRDQQRLILTIAPEKIQGTA